MAYEYDQMGNVVGEYESDEERRRREQANQPVKQTITYNPDGTQEVTIKGTPEALSPVNPNTPTLTAPGDATYNRMLQVESGNRDYLPNGQPVTSPKGAMFAGQVMPSTAAAPGYGVRPAAAQTPEEYNRVGQEYYQAMLKKFGGNEAAAAAAYNAGPGRVQQNMQANAGQMNVQQLPRETQGYLQKIGQMASNMIPSAQAGTLPPPAPVAPTAMPAAAPAPQQQPPASYVTGAMPSNQGIRIPGLTPVGQMPAPVDSTTQMINRYQSIQDNPQELMKLGYSEDPAVPEWMRNRARTRTAELITQQRETAAAKEQIPNMSESEIAAALRKKTTDGNYVKAALFAMLGMENSAMAEAAKLGIGRETFSTVNGQPAMVKMAANGTPIEGYNAATGKKLSAEELVAAAQYASVQKGAQTHTGKMQDMRTGEVYYERTTPQGIELVDNNGKRYTGPSQNLRPFGIGSDIQTKNQIQINELQNKLAFAGPTERARIVAENEAKFGPLDPGVKQQALGTVTGTVPTQATQAPGTAPAPAQPGGTAPGVTAPAPAAGAMTPALRESQQRGREEVMKKAGDVVAGADKIVTELVNTERAATDALTKKTNFGTIISGIIPGEQAIGEMFKTQDYINTQNILDVVNKQAAVNAKMLGTNPTDRDLQFVTATKPDKTWPADAVSEWLRKSADGTRRTLDFARRQMESGGTYIPETPQAAPPAATVPPASQFKIISVTPGPR